MPGGLVPVGPGVPVPVGPGVPVPLGDGVGVGSSVVLPGGPAFNRQAPRPPSAVGSYS